MDSVFVRGVQRHEQSQYPAGISEPLALGRAPADRGFGAAHPRECRVRFRVETEPARRPTEARRSHRATRRHHRATRRRGSGLALRSHRGRAQREGAAARGKYDPARHRDCRPFPERIRPAPADLRQSTREIAGRAAAQRNAQCRGMEGTGNALHGPRTGHSGVASVERRGRRAAG